MDLLLIMARNIKLSASLNLRPGIKQAEQTDSVIRMFIRSSDLCACTWFRVVKHFGLDVLLCTCFTDGSILNIFLIEGKVAPWDSCPVSMLSSLRMVSLILSETYVANEELASTLELDDADQDKEEEEFHLFLVYCQINTPFTQAAVIVTCH